MEQDPERRQALSHSQTWLQLGCLILALRSLGVEVGPMNGMDVTGLNSELLAGTALEAIAVLAAGYPGADACRPRAARLSPELVIGRLSDLPHRR